MKKTEEKRITFPIDWLDELWPRVGHGPGQYESLNIAVLAIVSGKAKPIDCRKLSPLSMVGAKRGPKPKGRDKVAT